MKKVLLVTSPSKMKNNFWTCSITSPIGSLMPPCDLASIAAVLRRDGMEPRIFDMRLYDDPMGAYLQEVLQWRPDAIVSNLGTASAMEDYAIFESVQDQVPVRIAFCFHAMALPEEVFQRGVTHILSGDPEYAVTKAVNGGGADTGVWVRENWSTPAGYIVDLDTLPFPALDLIKVRAYHSILMGRDTFSILLATRGCPHKCTYCVIPFMLGSKVRIQSVRRVVDEMEWHAREFGVSKFFFIDSAINLKEAWLREFCQTLIDRGLKIKWCANMRVAPVSEELLQLMKRSGCFRVFFGVEDLDRVLDLQRKTDAAETIKAFNLTRKVGLESVAFTILVPGMDNNEWQMASRIIRMVGSLKADALQCNIAIPYPGSQLFREYDAKMDMPRDWSLYDPAGNQAPYMTDLDFVKVRRLVYIGYFLTHPRCFIRTLFRTDIRSLVSFTRNALGVLRGNGGKSKDTRA